MTYTKQEWADDDITKPLSAERMLYIEEGIETAHELAADAAEAAHTHTSADITDATASSVADTIVLRDATGFFAAAGIVGLSTATGATQAVPKSQLDDGLADKAAASHTHDYADSTHTHVAADVTDFEDEVEAKVSTLLVQGEGIVLDYDALTHTLEIAATGSLVTVDYDDMPAGSTFTIQKDPVTGWPDRYSAREDLVFIWSGADPNPSTATPPAVNGAYAGVDKRFVES